MMRVLLAVEPDRLRSALRFVVEHECGIQLVASVTDAASLVELCAASGPDVALIDWDLPGLTHAARGAVTLGRLFSAHPALHVIVLGGHPEDRAAALAAGAHQFVSKSEPPERLLAALRSMNGAGTSA
jgi:DNA-binding NarL/FixJ family response regulator